MNNAQLSVQYCIIGILLYRYEAKFIRILGIFFIVLSVLTNLGVFFETGKKKKFCTGPVVLSVLFSLSAHSSFPIRLSFDHGFFVDKLDAETVDKEIRWVLRLWLRDNIKIEYNIEEDNETIIP